MLTSHHMAASSRRIVCCASESPPSNGGCRRKMLKNAKAKGSRLERRSRDVLRQAGFLVVKAGGSLGPIDLLAIHPETHGVQAVQVKANRWPGKVEMQELINLSARFNGDTAWQVAIHRWDDRRALRMRLVWGAGSFSWPFSLPVTAVTTIAMTQPVRRLRCMARCAGIGLATAAAGIWWSTATAQLLSRRTQIPVRERNVLHVLDNPNHGGVD